MKNFLYTFIFLTTVFNVLAFCNNSINRNMQTGGLSPKAGGGKYGK